MSAVVEFLIDDHLVQASISRGIWTCDNNDLAKLFNKMTSMDYKHLISFAIADPDFEVASQISALYKGKIVSNSPPSRKGLDIPVTE